MEKEVCLRQSQNRMRKANPVRLPTKIKFDDAPCDASPATAKGQKGESKSVAQEVAERIDRKCYHPNDCGSLIGVAIGAILAFLVMLFIWLLS